MGKYTSPFAERFGKKTINMRRPEYYRTEIAFRYIEDKDIVDKLQSVPNKHEYMRKLIRDDIRREKEALK